jgi:hypothetical protein
MRQTFWLLVLLVAGCAQGKSTDVPVPLDQVPEAVMRVAQEKLPGVKFDQAWKKGDGNYELRGRDKRGKVRDIDLTPSGEVLEIE